MFDNLEEHETKENYYRRTTLDNLVVSRQLMSELLNYVRTLV